MDGHTAGAWDTVPGCCCTGSSLLRGDQSNDSLVIDASVYLQASATYKLTAANELVMEFRATTDAATPINMCNHTYWNLSGNLKSKIHDHVLALDCTHYVTAGAYCRCC